jgi:hypothetical protein
VTHNIQAKHPDFVQKIGLAPNFFVILISNLSKRIMMECCNFFVDRTFRTTECGLVLTIVLGIYEGIAVPCAWLFANSCTTSMYKKLYKVCKLIMEEMSV